MLFGDLVSRLSNGPYGASYGSLWGLIGDTKLGQKTTQATWGLFGDLVSRLSNGPCGASYGLLWGLIGDTKWTY